MVYKMIDLIVYVLGAIVLGTYVGLVLSLWLDWLASDRAWGGLLRGRWAMYWAFSAFGSIFAFFQLLSADFPIWVWLWFLISAMTWVPFLFVDAAWKTRLALLSVWSTAGATVAIFVQSLDRDEVTILAAAWFMVHHVFMDGIVWVSPPPKVLSSAGNLQFQPVSNDAI